MKKKIIQKIESGIMPPTTRRLGKRLYKGRAPQFKEFDEVNPNLSKAEASLEPLREHFDGVYRRGLLEPQEHHRKKNHWRIKKMRWIDNPNVKYYKGANKKTDETENITVVE